jgi:hypothetical protein
MTDRFVDRFPESMTRRGICDGFVRLRSELLGMGISATQWADGSFVETKLNPSDVDVVSFCDYDFLNAHVADLGSRAVQLLAGGNATKASHQTHTFLVPSCSPGHPFFVVFEQHRVYWRNWFGTTRASLGESGHSKGFIQLTLGAEAPQISDQRQS